MLGTRVTIGLSLSRTRQSLPFPIQHWPVSRLTKHRTQQLEHHPSELYPRLLRQHQLPGHHLSARFILLEARFIQETGRPAQRIRHYVRIPFGDELMIPRTTKTEQEIHQVRNDRIGEDLDELNGMDPRTTSSASIKRIFHTSRCRTLPRYPRASTVRCR